MNVDFKKLQVALIATALTALAACHKDEATTPPPAADQAPAAAPADSSAATPAPSTDAAPAASASAGGAVDDTVITTKVKAALIAESSLKAGDITVETKQGNVTLGGTVETVEQGAKAESIAKATAGVTGVTNQLTVKK